MTDLVFKTAGTLAPEALHQAFSAAFSDYLIGPFQLSVSQWPRFLARQGAQLALSRAALRGGKVISFAFVAPRPELGSWRLAAMGSVPEARGSGAAAALLDDFVQRAAEAGMQRVELECFARNERALRLYEGRGFQRVHELHGYARAAGESRRPAAPAAAGLAVALQDAFDWLDAASRARGDLPLQVTAASLREQPVPLMAWRRGSAQMVFADAGGETAAGELTVLSLVDLDPAQRDAEALLAALLHERPGKRFAVPQLQRRDLGGDALHRQGFAPLPLHQWLMFRPLGGALS